MKHRTAAKTDASSIIRRQILLTVLVVIVFGGIIGILAWNNSRSVSSTVLEMEQDILQTQRKALHDILFERNPYLQPDAFYLGKLESVFYRGKAQEGTWYRTDEAGREVETETVIVVSAATAVV